MPGKKPWFAKPSHVIHTPAMNVETPFILVFTLESEPDRRIEVPLSRPDMQTFLAMLTRFIETREDETGQRWPASTTIGSLNPQEGVTATPVNDPRRAT